MGSQESSSRRTKRSEWKWTNERHKDYLNSMEASFVRTMLLQNNDITNTPSSPPLPLDRYLPDTADSTLDLITQRRRRYSTSDILESRRDRCDKRSRRLPYQPRNVNVISSKDQVVPQFESRNDDGSDIDEKDHQLN